MSEAEVKKWKDKFTDIESKLARYEISNAELKEKLKINKDHEQYISRNEYDKLERELRSIRKEYFVIKYKEDGSYDARETLKPIVEDMLSHNAPYRLEILEKNRELFNRLWVKYTLL